MGTGTPGGMGDRADAAAGMSDRAMSDQADAAAAIM